MYIDLPSMLSVHEGTSSSGLAANGLEHVEVEKKGVEGSSGRWPRVS